MLPKYFVFVVKIVYAGPKSYKFRDIGDFLAFIVICSADAKEWTLTYVNFSPSFFFHSAFY